MEEGPILIQGEIRIQFMLPYHTSRPLKIDESKIIQAIVLILYEGKTALVSRESPGIGIRVGVVDTCDGGHEDFVVRVENRFYLCFFIRRHC